MKNKLIRQMRKWHIWLGWVIGIPLILWTATGLFMVLQPIETVRGNHLRSEQPNLAPIVPVPPVLAGRQAKSLTLKQDHAGPFWVIEYVDGGKRRADPASGQLLPPITAAEADNIARTARNDGEPVKSVTRFDGDKAPMDQRSGRPSWQVAFADGANFYVDADSGELIAVRTQFWRMFDFMWGLHIMDPQTREDTSHPLLIGMAVIGLAGSLLGFIMLFTRRKTIKSANTQQSGKQTSGKQQPSKAI